MADMTMILPYDRVSPLYIPQRDLVLSSADSLWLTVTVVESDTPTAQALVLTGGIGGPACMLAVWPDWRRWGTWDYGAGAPWAAQAAGPVNTLWTGAGTLSDAIGSFDIFMPATTMATWPRRCRWGVLLDFDGGGQAELIAEGCLHVRPMVSRGITPTILLTDPAAPAFTDVPETIFLEGMRP